MMISAFDPDDYSATYAYLDIIVEYGSLLCNNCDIPVGTCLCDEQPFDFEFDPWEV